MQRPSLAELIGALSLATDLAAGLGYETALRVCIIATGIGRAAGLDPPALSDVYYTALLRFIGCTAFAHETAWRYGAGDDLAFLGALASADSSKPHEGLKLAIAAQPKTAGFARRAAAVARLLADAQGPKKFAVAHCDLAVQLSAKLGMRPAVIEALGQMYERWDGRGNPNQLRGDAITRPARLLHLGFELAVHASIGGPSAAIELAKTRSGHSFDPALARTFLAHGPEILAPLAAPSVWEHFLVAEPEPRRRLEQPAVDVAHAFACYVDVKSPFTLGHSTGVARLAEAAAQATGLSADETARVRMAGLLHDLGRVSVPNGLWDKPGPLNAVEWDRVKQHATHTERILGQSALFAPYGRLACADHERRDGSGYPRGATQIDRSASVLAAADTYVALCEPRAYRAAHSAEHAARELVTDPKLDRAAADAVLTAAGQRAAPQLRGELRAGLSNREIEVLVLLARGLSNKEIARALAISPKTAQHHVAHIYEKTNVSSRAAAATYAVVNGLATP